MFHPLPFESPNYNTEGINTSERLFPNGRIFRASAQRIIEFEDENGTHRYNLTSQASADCGCYSPLAGLYMCEIDMQRVVCSRHAIICVQCRRVACNQCSGLAVPEEAAEQVNPPAIPLCIACIGAAIEMNTPLLIRALRRLFKWMCP